MTGEYENLKSTNADTDPDETAAARGNSCEYEVQADPGFESEECHLQDEVWEAIMGLLRDGRLKSRLKPLCLFRGKEYIARDGWGGSPLDISLEAGRPESGDGFLLMAISCLEGEDAVTRDDVENFAGRLAKIGGSIAGFMVASGAIYKDAFKKASSLGIGLVRLLPSSQVLWLNTNMSPLSFREYDRIDPSDFTGAFFDPAHVGQNRAFYAFSDHHLFGDWISLLEHHLK